MPWNALIPAEQRIPTQHESRSFVERKSVPFETLRFALSQLEKRDCGYWVPGTHVSLDSMVYAFLRGTAPEAVAQSYPVLSLEEVYGAITLYLANLAQIDTMLTSNDGDFELLRKLTREANLSLSARCSEGKPARLSKNAKNGAITQIALPAIEVTRRLCPFDAAPDRR
jgi:uncharacterized protein (DUF433 family)